MGAVSLVAPEKRLDILKEYMAKWIDEWPRPKQSFYDFFKRRYNHLIPGTVDHAKNIATHCFYCDTKLIKGNSDGDLPNRSSIDHYLPQSIGKTERIVICCAKCNTSKGSVRPEKLVSMIIKAHLTGKTMWDYHGKTLKRISDQIQKITNDMLYNMGPKIYYIKK